MFHELIQGLQAFLAPWKPAHHNPIPALCYGWGVIYKGAKGVLLQLSIHR